MDLRKTIEDLRREKQKLERVIASLEGLEGAVTATPLQRKRRGRKSMGAEERLRVSTRMKLLWASMRPSTAGD
jgi:hypothetical protein